jgi:hypothetical protein
VALSGHCGAAGHMGVVRHASATMPLRRSKLARILAALNVLVLITLLAPKTPEFDRLRAEDAVQASGELNFLGSEEPLYVAGRPLYGGELVFGVSLAERAYVFANAPAILASLAVALPLSGATATLVAGSNLTPSVWTSWVLAGTLTMAVATWAFTIGTIVDKWRGASTRAA